MLTGNLPFNTEPPNNISLLHQLILRGPHLPGHITDSKSNTAYLKILKAKRPKESAVLYKDNEIACTRNVTVYNILRRL